MKIFVENNPNYLNEVKYIFSLFAFNKKIAITFVESISDSELSIGHLEHNSIKIDLNFYVNLKNGMYDHMIHFKKSSFVELADGTHDYLSTAFYLVSCVQEIGSKAVDKFGRFQYASSFQKRFDLVETNLVQICFDSLSQLPILSLNSGVVNGNSRIFLSHDMDSIHGSIMQDGFFTLKKFRPDQLFSILIKNLIDKPSWLNVDRIMKMESEADFTSTFFWLVNKGKVDERLSNSDYNINDVKVRSAIESISKSKWENGLHKSASDDSFSVELDKLKTKVVGNRYHYLKFNPEVDFQKIEDAGLLFDSSLGFAERSGFRNCYGQPYRPFNLKTGKAYNFIECPLNIMDTTFHNYLKLNSADLEKATIDFCEKHKKGNVLSVLFHNNYISDFKYKGYITAFRNLLKYFYESDLKSISQSEIIKEYHYEY